MNLIGARQLATGWSDADVWGCEQEADRIYRTLTGTEDSPPDQRS